MTALTLHKLLTKTLDFSFVLSHSLVMKIQEVIDNLDDEKAELIGRKLAEEFMLKRSSEHRDRWQLAGGTFRNKGVARRAARIFVEICRD